MALKKIKPPKRVIIDYETLPIAPRPVYPPAPVGVSIQWPGKKPRYYAWGHLDGNNCSWGEAYRALKEVWDATDHRVVCQNGKFDFDVSEEHMGLPLLPWERMDDTMFLIFLDDPHQQELGLKPAAVRLLGQDPDEQDEVHDWLIKNQPIPGIKINRGKAGENYAGKYIAFAPGGIVGKYANGDTQRTGDIFDLLYPKTVARGMEAAYDRERELMPILLAMERRGIAVDSRRLAADIASYEKVAAQVDAFILKKLKAPRINLDSGDELMEAMLAAGIADKDNLVYTPGGKVATNKDALLVSVADKGFLALMRYRAGLATCLGTFMKPWMAESERTGGLVSTSWNQVRSPKGNDNQGARTGRLSASRFMNMPKEFNAIWAHEDPANKKLPKCPIKDLPSLPWVRSYITAFPGHVLIDRDYSQQEPRILAHFDGGELADKYNEEPWTDLHDYAQAELKKFGLEYERKPVKTVNLGLIYGMGVGLLAQKTDQTVEATKRLKDAMLNLYPGLKEMQKEMKRRYKAGEPITTWGGREYYCEEPRVMGGRVVHFDYKLVNVLIQGSAADCTKEAVIRWNREVHKLGKQDEWFLILTVHDQLTASAPADEWEDAMELLRVVMTSVEFDVPMLSEGSYSFTNWAELIDYDKRGKLVYDGASARKH